MRCPPFQRCPVCRRQLIHRGVRSQYESASELGQIIFNLMPVVFGIMDVDVELYRRTLRLFRSFELKTPTQHRKDSQMAQLKVRAAMVAHLKECPDAKHAFNLHPDSGVFLIEGDPEEGNRLGAATVTDLYNGKSWHSDNEEEILCWLALLDGCDREFIRDKLGRRRFTENWRQYELFKKLRECPTV